jgi:Alpha/beta hydrolase domain
MTGKAKLLAALAALLPLAAQAEVTRLTVETRTPIDGGYELLSGHFSGALNPADPHNAIITDIRLAPRNAAGKVEYTSTFAIAMPIDKSKASGVLVYDVPNRGRGAAVALPGGHIDVVSGWQGDVLPGDGRQTIALPTAPVTGMAMARFFNMPAGTTTLPVRGGPQGGIDGRNFEPVTAKGAKLYRATADDKPQELVPARDWALADCDAAPFPGKPDLTRLCVKGGFDARYAYTLVFRAGHPKLLGIGFAATRDLVAFLRHAEKDAAGNPNPLAGQVRWAIGRGSSQSGNFLRSLIRLGFNSAEDGGVIFDGLNPTIAPRQLAMNVRFGAPGGLAYLYEAGSDGPDWWNSYDDTARGLRRASLLDRCNAAHNCPKIIESYGAAEFWNLRASPDFVGTDAKADIPLPANVRRYYNASVTHGGGAGGFARLTNPVNGCVLAANPAPSSDIGRALFVALVDWVTRGVEPPQSKYPTLAAGDLVAPNSAAMGFPTIPGTVTPDHQINPLIQYDFGKSFHIADVSGVIDPLPPKVVRTLPSVVPRVDADGNELAGIRSPLVDAPLGTYVGWNATAAGYRAGQFCGNSGGYIPFAATRAERLSTGDPRPSVEERYPSHEAYVARVKMVADRLVAQRYLLAEDAARMVQQASDSDVRR